MKLNHINLPVSDVSQAKDFLTTYFGLQCLQERGHNVIAIMRNNDGLILTLSHFDKSVSDITYPRRLPRRIHSRYARPSERDLRTLEGGRIQHGAASRVSWELDLLFASSGGFLVEVQAMG